MNVTKCLACHNPHSTEAVILDGKTDACGACHKYHGPTADDNYGLYSSNGQGRTPHYGGIASVGGYVDGTQRTQYMSQGAVCTDCHGHNNTINEVGS